VRPRRIGAHPGPSSIPHAAQPRRTAHVSFWIRELPFTLVLILTIAGVAYTSFSKKPIVGYWEILAPIIAMVCVAAGWQKAGDKSGRLQLGAKRPDCAAALCQEILVLEDVLDAGAKPILGRSSFVPSLPLRRQLR
jgi:hypothetical protein